MVTLPGCAHTHTYSVLYCALCSEHFNTIFIRHHEASVFRLYFTYSSYLACPQSFLLWVYKAIFEPPGPLPPPTGFEF